MKDLHFHFPVDETGAPKPQLQQQQATTGKMGLQEIAETDPNLQRLISVWPTLPSALKQAILTFVGALNSE